MKTLQSISTGGRINLGNEHRMNDLQKHLSTCLLATAALLGGASAAFAADAASGGTEVAGSSAGLAEAAAALTGVLNPSQSTCNQGVGNGPESDEFGECDPGNSNHNSGSNDALGGPGDPGRKGGNK